MLAVAARGSSPEERKTVSTLHSRLLTPLPGQQQADSLPAGSSCPLLPLARNLTASRKNAGLYSVLVSRSSTFLCSSTMSFVNSIPAHHLPGVPTSFREAGKLPEVRNTAWYILPCSAQKWPWHKRVGRVANVAE